MPARKPALRPQIELLEAREVPSFGTGGRVVTDIVPDGRDFAEAVAAQPDGRVVAAGNGGLARYNPDGSLDRTFNASGAQPGTIQTPGYLNDVIVQNDGKVLVAGTVTANGETRFLLRRFLSDGTADESFGAGGAVTTRFKKSSADVIDAVAIQPDGKIVAAGLIDGAWGVARYYADGTLDGSFDRDGWLTTAFRLKSQKDHAHAVAVQADGRIVVAGQTIGDGGMLDFAVARYNANGPLDTSFGSAGKVQIDLGSEHGRASSSDSALDLALQTDGKIVLSGGSSAAVDRFALVRLNANGSLDSSLAGDGKLAVNTPVGDNSVKQFKGVAVQSDGKIVAVGGIGTVYVVRFNTDGSLDESFDGDGWRYFGYSDPQTFNDYGNELLLQPDGKILLVGGTGFENTQNFALARLNADGSFDDGP